MGWIRRLAGKLAGRKERTIVFKGGKKERIVVFEGARYKATKTDEKATCWICHLRKPCTTVCKNGRLENNLLKICGTFGSGFYFKRIENGRDNQVGRP